MARKPAAAKRIPAPTARSGRPSSLLDTRIIYCGDCLDQVRKLPDGCVDLIYLDYMPARCVEFSGEAKKTGSSYSGFNCHVSHDMPTLLSLQEGTR